MLARVHTSSSCSKVMFLSLGLEPKASDGVLQRTTVEERVELQRRHFPTSVPGLLTTSLQPPQPPGDPWR
ncbi:hypothetical protein NQZ68_037072 [Dissostichus eleginoides]|nr:hypothetical protein NQZ68_037072 [Dissostichus eleginoides]